MNSDYKEQCWKRYLENQKYEKYDKEDLVDEIMELQQENQQLKKQKDDVVNLIHKELDRFDCEGSMSISMRISYFKEDLLRMLGEIE